MMSWVKEKTYRTIAQLPTSTIEDTIVITGSPRSGTTWLLELLRALPSRKAMNEPLLHDKKARTDHGFTWRTFISPEAPAPKQRDYLKNILRGRLGVCPAWHFQATSRTGKLIEHVTNHRLVVKLCRINRMLHWFAQQFEVRGPVLIVRHPCAVVASMLKHGAWDREKLHWNEAQKIAVPESGLPTSLQSTFGSILEQVETLPEALAAKWSLDHYVPLIHHAREEHPWILVPYERLVTQGQNELRRITDALNVEQTNEMRVRLEKPSSSVKDFSRDAEQQLSKWRRRLSSRQIDSILSITDQVGISKFYTKKLEPNYEALNDYQVPSSRW